VGAVDEVPNMFLKLRADVYIRFVEKRLCATL
jgi:hypothetical protein